MVHHALVKHPNFDEMLKDASEQTQKFLEPLNEYIKAHQKMKQSQVIGSSVKSSQSKAASSKKRSFGSKNDYV